MFVVVVNMGKIVDPKNYTFSSFPSSSKVEEKVSHQKDSSFFHRISKGEGKKLGRHKRQQ